MKRALVILAAILVTAPAIADDTRPNQLGQSGLIHMPDGRVADDGTLRFGVGNMEPYGAVWGSITLVPWLEVNGRFTRINGVPAFGPTGFGDIKDKAFDFKLRLLQESEWLPALAFGRQDFHGTGQFPATYVAASKRFEFDDLGRFDLTVGRGNGRIDGEFGGLRFRPAWDLPLAFLLEYDAFDYANDTRARRTGEVIREGGLGVGVEYTYGWMTGQLSHQDGYLGINFGFSVPLSQRTFAAKTDEPPPVELTRSPLPSGPAMVAEPAILEPMYGKLHAEGFYGVTLLVEGDTLLMSAGSFRYSTIGRAANRAARVVAAFAPEGIDALELTFIEYNLPIATYRFADLDVYRAWLVGTATPAELQATLSIAYVNDDDWDRLMLDGIDYPAVRPAVEDEGGIFNRGGVLSSFALSYYHPSAGTFRLVPFKLGFVFNDPGGVLKYDIFSSLQYSLRFDHEWYLGASVDVRLAENISDSISNSNSLLPRVRSDVPEYAREGGTARIGSIMVGYQAQVADRTYVWLTGGILEQMFSGFGGEVLYMPERGNWAVDLHAYAVRQRDFEGYFGHKDYETVTALAGVHYRIPKVGLTLTARGGRFLAGDSGVRFEFKRRFLSGFEMGAWYTVTDANDRNGPSRPDPYYDKGIFMRFVASPLMKRDSATYADFRFQPWIRDGGAVLNVSGGLYDEIERRLMLNMDDLGPWSDFGQ